MHVDPSIPAVRPVARASLFCAREPGRTGSGRLQEKLRCAWGHCSKGEEGNPALETSHPNAAETGDSL